MPGKTDKLVDARKKTNKESRRCQEKTNKESRRCHKKTKNNLADASQEKTGGRDSGCDTCSQEGETWDATLFQGTSSKAALPRPLC